MLHKIVRSPVTEFQGWQLSSPGDLFMLKLLPPLEGQPISLLGLALILAKKQTHTHLTLLF